MTREELVALRDRLSLWSLQPHGQVYAATVEIIDAALATGRTLHPDESASLVRLRAYLDSVEMSMISRFGGCA